MGSPSDLPPRPERDLRARIEVRPYETRVNGACPAPQSDRARPTQIVIDPEDWGHDATD